jgi:hypothetical protein
MTRSSVPTIAASQPLATAPLLGGSPLIRGENVRSYDELLERICATLQPRDSLEEIWIHDTSTWSGRRFGCAAPRPAS